MKERKLGEVFHTKKGITLKVEAYKDIYEDCQQYCYYFHKKKCGRIVCIPSQRTDGTSIIYVKQ